jgi:hypothetical protein
LIYVIICSCSTEEEKEAAKSKVDQALTEAKTHINEAENDDGVDSFSSSVASGV